jgi:RNA polymerase sigma-70 factor, ECF subfamily
MPVDADADAPWRAGPGWDPDEADSDRSKRFLRQFLQNERRLYAYVRTLLPNRADADDALQEAALVMWDKFDEAAPPDDFAAWGCRIIYFKVLDFYKKAGRARVRFSQALLERVAETAIEQAGALRLDARRDALAGCIEKLGARDRELLARRYAAGATTRSTADHLGRSPEAVYKALARVRRALLDCVQRTLEREDRP